MDFMQEYEKWLSSPALSPAEHEELESIRGDEKEIESRFYDQLAFGTAGLRGTMGVGLNRMNIHVIRHATQLSPRSFWKRAPRRWNGAWPYASTAVTTPISLPGRPPASWRATVSPCACSKPCAPPPS